MEVCTVWTSHWLVGSVFFARGFDAVWAFVIHPCGYSSVDLFIAGCSLVWGAQPLHPPSIDGSLGQFGVIVSQAAVTISLPIFLQMWAFVPLGNVLRSETCHGDHVFRLWQLALSFSKVVVPMYIYTSKSESLLVPEPSSEKMVGAVLISIFRLHHSVTLRF